MTQITRGSVNYCFLQRNSLQRVWESIGACGWQNFVAKIKSESLRALARGAASRHTVWGKNEERKEEWEAGGNLAPLFAVFLAVQSWRFLLRINPIPKATKASETVMGEGREGGFICTYLSNLGQNVFGCSIPTSSQSFWNCDTLSRVSYTCER